MKKIAHLSSVHPREDVRIFWKELSALVAAGYDASLVIADGKGDAVSADGIKTFDVGKPSGGRLSRMTQTTKKVLAKALELDADLYHLHDPELLPIAMKLKSKGKSVIFDSHEDFPADILSKPYLKPWLRRIVSRTFAAYEKYICRRIDYVITATPAIRKKFERLGCKTLDVNNYPLLGELQEATDWALKGNQVCYVGAMTQVRGLLELVDAIGRCSGEVGLAIAGEFTETGLEEACRSNAGWTRVNYHGFLTRAETYSIMESALAGVVTFLPAPNHIDSQPNKMFEYMSAGIPVIGSNFPLWKEILEGNSCGICVDPTDPKAISDAIVYVDSNRAQAMEMGRCGREAVLKKYNWQAELPKLLTIYESVLNG